MERLGFWWAGNGGFISGKVGPLELSVGSLAWMLEKERFFSPWILRDFASLRGELGGKIEALLEI